MNIRYPLRKADGQDDKNYDELLSGMRKPRHGRWLIGVNRDYVKTDDGQQQRLRQSGTFVLVRSLYKADEQDESCWLTLYQLDMHMAPLAEYPNARFIVSRIREMACGCAITPRTMKAGTFSREESPVMKRLNGGFLEDQVPPFTYHRSVWHKKNAEFLFKDSEIYNYRVYAYSWGRYHDPFRRESGTGKDNTEALSAYQRAITLYQRQSESGKISDIEEKINHLNEQ